MTHPQRQGLGRLDENRIVEQIERLQRRIGALALHARRESVGRVEVDQHGVRRRAPEENVDASPVAFRAALFGPVLSRVTQIADAFRLRRMDARTADAAKQ